MANEIVLTSREKERQGGRKGFVGGRASQKDGGKEDGCVEACHGGERQTEYEVRE